MKYWIFHHSVVVGPFDAAQLAEMAAFDGSSLVCAEASTGLWEMDWVRAESVAEIERALAARSSPSPVAARRYWVLLNGVACGPFPAEQLRTLSGLDVDTSICPESLDESEPLDWRRVVDFPELIQPSAGRPDPGEGGPSAPDGSGLTGADQSMNTMGSKIEEADRSVDRLRRQLDESGAEGEAVRAMDESAQAVEQLRRRYAELAAHLAALRSRPSEDAPSALERTILAGFGDLTKTHQALERRLLQLESRLDAPPAPAAPRPEPGSEGLGSLLGGGAGDLSLGGSGGLSLDSGGLSLGGGEGLSLGGGMGQGLSGGGGSQMTPPPLPPPPPPPPPLAEIPAAPEPSPPLPPFPPAAALVEDAPLVAAAFEEPAPAPRSRRPIAVAAVAAAVGGMIVAGFLWSRRVPRRPAAERAAEMAAEAIPAPAPAPDPDVEFLEKVRAYPLASRGKTLGVILEEALAVPDVDTGKAAQRWSVSGADASGKREVEFRSDRLDPETGSPLVYRFQVEDGGGRVRGSNLPARAILREP